MGTYIRSQFIMQPRTSLIKLVTGIIALGDEASRMCVNEEARKNYERALELTEVGDFLTRYSIHKALFELYGRTGKTRSQRVILTELYALAEKLDILYWMDVKICHADMASRTLDLDQVFESVSSVLTWIKFERGSGHFSDINSINEDVSQTLLGLVQVTPEPARLEIEALYYLGKYYSGIHTSYDDKTQPRKEEAISLMEEALVLAQTRGYPMLESRILLSLGWLYLVEDNQKAIEFGLQVLEFARAHGDLYLESSVLDLLGVVFGEIGEHVEALKHRLEGKKISKEIGNRTGYAYAVNHLVQFYQMVGRLDLLLDDLSEVNEFAPELENLYLQTYPGFIIGVIHCLQGDFETALKFIEPAAEIINHDKSYLQSYLVMRAVTGLTYERMGNRHRAWETYQDVEMKIVSIASEDFQINPLVGFIHCPLAGKARLSLDAGKYEEALLYVEKMLPVLHGRRMMDDGELMNSYFSAYHVLVACNDERAIPVLREAFEKMSDLASHVKDEEWKCQFFESNPYHARIVREWDSVKNLSKP